MTPAQATRSVIKSVAWLSAGATGIALVGAASVAVSGWLISGVEQVNPNAETATERSTLGEYFGGASAVFSGLALLLLIITLLYQQKELRLQRQELSLQREELIASRNELRRGAESEMRSLHIQLTQMALSDDTLSDVWNVYPDETESGRRQMLFANLAFSHFVLAKNWGTFSDTELLVHAHSMLRSPTFRRYWDATKDRKRQLPPESDEGRVFGLFDRAIEELDRETNPPTR
ncbi:DUF6082 family protein [Streptomyces tauricus]|uniref:DUF6082 family protein n=1 Tax=Streptomyces tauricus TaxID=68274 RepID=A0ABZ1JCT9_9ACTN|nr:DUF6082 family protein [Streptomyces tauricus]